MYVWGCNSMGQLAKDTPKDVRMLCYSPRRHCKSRTGLLCGNLQVWVPEKLQVKGVTDPILHIGLGATFTLFGTSR